MAVRKGRREGDEKARTYLLLFEGGGRESFYRIREGEPKQSALLVVVVALYICLSWFVCRL